MLHPLTLKETTINFTEFAALGYDPIPVIPRDKRPRDPQWQIKQYAYDECNKIANYSVGVRTGKVCAIDVDCLDKVVSKAIDQYLIESFFKCSVPTRIGRAPKFLMLFRMKRPGRKITLKATKDGVDSRIEILRKGQQFVAQGIHPDTNKPYRWTRPLIHADELPNLTERQLVGMLADIAEILDAHGYNVDTYAVKGVEATKTWTQPEWDEKDLETVVEALAYIDAEDYDTWVKVGMSIHAGSHGNDDGFAIWDAWSESSEKYKAGACEKKWKGFKPGEIGTGTLFALAKEGGYQTTSPLANDAVEGQGLKTLDLARLGVEGKPVTPAQVISGWLPRHVVGMCSGHGGSGKSYVVLEAAIRLALGEACFGNLHPRTHVLYFSCEDDTQVLSARIWNICAKLARPLADLVGYLTVVDMVDEPAAALYNATGFTDRANELEELAVECGAQLVVIDNVSDVYDADENTRATVRTFIRGMNRMAKRIGGSVLLLAHVNKTTAKNKEAVEVYSGSTAWNNSVRVRWALYEDNVQMVLELQKTNYGRPGARMDVKWDDASSTFELTTAQRRSTDEIALEILVAMSECTEPLPVSIRASTGTTFQILRAMRPGLFAKSTTSTQLMDTLIGLQAAGHLEQAEVKTGSVKRGGGEYTVKQWVITEKGRAAVKSVKNQ